MKNIKKAIFLETITLVIVGLVITSTASIVTQKPETSMSSKVITTQVFNNKSPIPQSTQMNEVTIPSVVKQTVKPMDIPVTSTEDDEIHPAITMYGGGLLWGGYTTQVSVMDQTINFLYSGDNGATWESPSYLDPSVLGVADYLAVDSLGDGVVATLQPDPGTSDQWRIIMPDPLDSGTWNGASWDWSSFEYVDFKNLDVAGYEFTDIPNAAEYYGWMTGTVSSPDAVDMPTFFFANGETTNSGWIWTWGDATSHSINSAVDIDDSKAKFYAVWENHNDTTGAVDILLSTGFLEDYIAADFANWGSDPTWETLGGEESNKNPDVAASNHHVYITCETDNAIVCFYSNDDGGTWSQSTVTSNGKYPTITASGTQATIAYVSNGNIFTAETKDGGVTWSDPAQINEHDGSVVMEYATTKITTYNHLLWTDNKDGNKDIYYDVGSATPQAILTIESISGGIGVSAVVKNTGLAAAENVDWSIVTEGTVFLGGEKSGQVTVQPGASVTIKTGLMLGFGAIDVTVTAGTATKKASGKLLLFFITGLE